VYNIGSFKTCACLIRLPQLKRERGKVGLHPSYTYTPQAVTVYVDCGVWSTTTCRKVALQPCEEYICCMHATYSAANCELAEMWGLYKHSTKSGESCSCSALIPPHPVPLCACALADTHTDLLHTQTCTKGWRRVEVGSCYSCNGSVPHRPSYSEDVASFALCWVFIPASAVRLISKLFFSVYCKCFKLFVTAVSCSCEMWAVFPLYCVICFVYI